MGKEYHADLYNHLQRLALEKTIDPIDLDLFLFTDSIEDAIHHINRYAIEGFGLKKRKKMKARKFLGERR